MNRKSVEVQTDGTDLKSWIRFRKAKPFIASQNLLPPRANNLSIKQTQTPKSFDSSDVPFAIPSKEIKIIPSTEFKKPSERRPNPTIIPARKQKNKGIRQRIKRKLRRLDGWQQKIDKIKMEIESLNEIVKEYNTLPDRPPTPGKEWMDEAMEKQANTPKEEKRKEPKEEERTQEMMIGDEKEDINFNECPRTPGDDWVHEFIKDDWFYF